MTTPKIIENAGQRVLTTAQLAKCYGTDSVTIKQNFSNNKERYTEGKHYILLTGDALRRFKREVENFDLAIPKNVNRYYLWTERGALLHAKSLNTDKAWQVYDFLVEHYFRTAAPKIPAAPTMSTEQIIAKNQAAALYELRKLQVNRALAESDVAIAVSNAAIARMDEAYFVCQHPELTRFTELLTLKSQ